jgi:hypothetical protein
MDIGEAFEEVAGGALGFVELAGTDEVDGALDAIASLRLRNGVNEHRIATGATVSTELH